MSEQFQTSEPKEGDPETQRQERRRNSNNKDASRNRIAKRRLQKALGRHLATLDLMSQSNETGEDAGLGLGWRMGCGWKQELARSFKLMAVWTELEAGRTKANPKRRQKTSGPGRGTNGPVCSGSPETGMCVTWRPSHERVATCPKKGPPSAGPPGRLLSVSPPNTHRKLYQHGCL